MATIRPATEADLPAILAIYNDAVMKTTAIWNEAPSDLESRHLWLAARRKAGFPVLVADEDGVQGYGSFGEFGPSRASAIPSNIRSMCWTRRRARDWAGCCWRPWSRRPGVWASG